MSVAEAGTAGGTPVSAAEAGRCTVSQPASSSSSSSGRGVAEAVSVLSGTPRPTQPNNPQTEASKTAEPMRRTHKHTQTLSARRKNHRPGRLRRGHRLRRRIIGPLHGAQSGMIGRRRRIRPGHRCRGNSLLHDDGSKLTDTQASLCCVTVCFGSPQPCWTQTSRRRQKESRS